KSEKENVNLNNSMPLGKAYRTANVMETMTSRRSTMKSTCFIRDLKGNDLLTGSRETDLYSITLQNTNYPNPICLVAKATSSQAWLWHHRLSHLNFDTINLLSKNDIVVGLPKVKFVKDHLCSSCELGKAKRKYFHTKLTPSSTRRLQLLHMDLCGPVRVVSINGKRYVLVIVDDYSRYTWTYFLRSKDETPATLHAYFAAEGIQHQMSIARTPEQNGVVERRNCTLVEAAQTMLSAAKVPLFFWAEAIATACFTQNRFLVIPRHEKTPYHIINERKLSVKFFYIFGSICYIVRDGENLDKIKEKGDECIFVVYSTQSKAYRVFNKRTRVIMESIHVNFDELPLLASDQNSYDPVPEYRTVTTSNELDLLFSPMFDELLNGSSKVVSKSSAVSAADALNQRQQLTTLLTYLTTHAPTCQIPPLAPSVISSDNINQAETHAENDQVADDEFINIFSTPVQDQRETSSRHVDSSNMHTFYQRFPSEHRWTKDHPLEQVIGNPSQSVRTRRQLESDAEMCMLALTVVSKSSAVTTADESIQCQQQHTTSLVNYTTPKQSCQVQSHESTVTSNENINQAETHAENDQVADDEFINIFSTPVQDQGERSSRHVDSSNMHTFYQRYPSDHRWTKDHPLEQVIGNPSQSVRTRRQLESDAEMCMFALTVSRTEPKNIKEAMADSAWIDSMLEELHQFDRLDVWELVDRPLCTNVINLKWLWKNKRLFIAYAAHKSF
nr:hypothetical protein [Tanacetum cinerariifolium]